MIESVYLQISVIALLVFQRRF